MGQPDTIQMSQEVPIVHPIIKFSKDHFRRNTAFTDGTYRVLEEQRKAYKYAEKVQFDDVFGLVKLQPHVHIKLFVYLYNHFKSLNC